MKRVYTISTACILLTMTGIVTTVIMHITQADEQAASQLSVRTSVSSRTRPASQYKLMPLPYAYDALEPYIDARTMHLHHDKHHKGYVDKLNKAMASYPHLRKYSVKQLLAKLDSLPQALQDDVRKYGGGDYNHSLFWTIMAPSARMKKHNPTGSLLKAINKQFGNFEKFKDAFSQAAQDVFGSGYAWLSVKLTKLGQKELVISITQNQDCPISWGLMPILVLDVWEHAYYLKYQNKREDFIAAWWHIVNWDQVAKNFEAAK